MNTPLKTTDKILSQQLANIRELLGKINVVEALVDTGQEQRSEILKNLARQQVLSELISRIKRLHVADVAYVIENLSPDERLLIWAQIDRQRAGEVLLELSEVVREQILSHISYEDLFTVLVHLDTDDIAYLADEIPAEVLERVVRKLSESERQFFDTSTTFDEDSVAHLMTHAFIDVRDQQTIAEVLVKLRGTDEYPTHLDKLFVLDKRGIFRGLLPIQTVLRHAPEKRVSEVMVADAVVFHPNDNAREASQAFERYDLISAPVLNDRGKLVGRLTVDDVMDYQRDKMNEEMLALAGLSKSEDIFDTIRAGVRNRRFWVVMNVVTALVASRVVGLFEATIAQVVALAALMPVVASVGGNTGNQTTALMIRMLAMGQLSKQNFKLMIRKELGINVVNGLLLGVGVGVFATVIYSNLKLGIVIGAAMLLNLLVAASVGLFAPFGLEKLGRDPVLGSSIILTATTDSVGFFIFLGLAAVFLV